MLSKYILPKDFVDTIDESLWRHVLGEGVIKDVNNHADVKKEAFLYELARRINDGIYRPQATKIIGFPKSKGVIRPVLHFGLEDVVVYYYCIKKLQDSLVAKINTTEYCFGGFRLTEKMTLHETSTENMIYDPEYESFVKYAFRKSWSDYQNLAKQLSLGSFDYYMHLDIAHFYDAIPLGRLEHEVRNCVVDSKNIIDLLFYLLKNVKTQHNYSYTENIVGIPQEEVGEMSRLLANFYLSYFDSKIVEELKILFGNSKGIEWQYTRYADDLWFAFKGEKSDALRVTQIVSQVLSDLSLHLNESKTKIMTPLEHSTHWCFNYWDKITFAKFDIEKLIIILKELYLEKDNDEETRWFSAFNYALKIVASSISTNRASILAESSFFIDIVLHNPQFVGRNNRSLAELVKEILRDSEPYRKVVLEYLSGPDAIYPLVSFVLWEVFLDLPYEEAIYQALSKRFYSEKWRDLWWYERCIFLNYYLVKKIYELDDMGLEKLLKHITSIADTLSDYERRYVIRLLMRLPDLKGSELLNLKFSEFRDKRLIEYIKTSKVGGK